MARSALRRRSADMQSFSQIEAEAKAAEILDLDGRPGASGGGATGNGSGKPSEKTMTRAEHDQRVARGESMGSFIRGGGSIVD